jgi:ParB-like chromosome segregation protein Spo0J
LGLAKDGTPTVIDGRHRLAAMRDAGVRLVPVTVPRAAARRFRELFGA